MKCIVNELEFHIEEKTVATIGKFDGRHVGHQKLLRKMQEIKAQHGCKAAVFTFNVPPLQVFGDKKQTVITTAAERRSNMEKTGVDYLIEYPFTEEIRHMDGEVFIKKILCEYMNAEYIVVGTDCSFGYKKSGNIELLKKFGNECGYHVIVIDKEKADQREISSTFVREELDKGNVEKVAKLLGEPYTVHGTVMHGNHIGTKLGFPTANIIPPVEKHLPKFGVYVSETVIDDKIYRGITNVGKKPTIDGEFPVGVETYIFDFYDDLYGKKIEVRLLAYERPEQKFNNLDELKDQLKKDIEFGKKFKKEEAEG